MMGCSSRLCFVALACSLLNVIHASLDLNSGGEIACEELGKEVCAFAIASSGKRCVLETERAAEYQCRTSEVVVERMSRYIETDQCIKACGVHRNTLGISSDALLDPNFTTTLCSPPCYHHCPNILDLYFNLAAAEGVFLPHLCHKQRINPHRAMIHLISAGAAPPPISHPSQDLLSQPAAAAPSPL